MNPIPSIVRSVPVAVIAAALCALFHRAVFDVLSGQAMLPGNLVDDGLQISEFIEQFRGAAGAQGAEHLMGFLDEFQAEQPRHFLGAGGAHGERAPFRRRDSGDAVADQLLRAWKGPHGRSSSRPCRGRSSAPRRVDQAGRRCSVESGECEDG